MNTDNAKEIAAAAATAGTALGISVPSAGYIVGPMAFGGPAVWAGAAIVGGCIWLAAKESSN
ncbi:MAG: hypothetical protein F6K31_21810 [Symploca sp. SIO2G7]|nr:hypothetical protein [Symploca sp. SIO2G7]